jgi:3-(3-hydroxy-phenyl)propionate hydroxylase
MINQNFDLAFDLAIVGYGPVGVTAANFLGMYGIKTVVFERKIDAYHLPRAIGLNHEIMRIFQQLGLQEQIESVVGAIDGVQFLNQAHKILFEVEFHKNSLSHGFSPNYVFYQPELEDKLREGVKRFDCVTVNLGHSVESIAQDKNGVSVFVHDLTSDRHFQVRVKYLLGCDGASSIIRQLAEIELHDFIFDRRQLVVDTFLKEKIVMPNVVQQFCNPQRSGVFVHSTKSHRRWEFVLLDSETKEEMENPEKVRELLAQYWINPDKLEIIRAAVYNFHSLLAKQWRRERIFIVGDAAHQMPPILGQGMCSGIRDAQNICWKLNLVLQGTTQEKFLDSYQVERSPHVEEIILLATSMFRLFKTHNFIVAFVRDFILKFLKNFAQAESLRNLGSNMPPLKNGILASIGGKKQQLAGQMFIQPRVRTQSGKLILLDEILGHHFAILALDNSWRQTISFDSASFFANLPVNFVTVLPREQESQLDQVAKDVEVITDISGQITKWFTKHQKKIVIIRPDRYVFGVYNHDEMDSAAKQLQSLLNGEALLTMSGKLETSKRI